jgi:hypothetical protein
MRCFRLVAPATRCPRIARQRRRDRPAPRSSRCSTVEAFNGRHPRSEAIYVLVALTDYYSPGVPGDRQAFDHPIFKCSAMLPAPWYRAGITSFDFDRELWACGVTALQNLLHNHGHP